MADNSIEETVCNKCGIEFWVPTRLMNERRKDVGEFFCPNGHSLMFKKESEEAIQSNLQMEINELKKKLIEQERLIPNKVVPLISPLVKLTTEKKE